MVQLGMGEIPKRTSDTRERILALAEQAVLAKGFNATSVEELVAAAAISRSGFFYHFSDKRTLAKALIQRYMEQEKILFDDLFRRAYELNDDPLHGFLVALKLFAEMMANLPEAHPGCMAAAFCYQDQLFDQEVRDLNAKSLLEWRERFREHLARIAEVYPTTGPTDLEAVADMATSLIEGGLILGRTLQDPTILPRQVMLYREFVRAKFSPA